MAGQVQKRAAKTVDPLALARKAKSGDVRAISQVMTIVENHEPSTKAVLRVLSTPRQRPMVIGMTGYPGAGKSSLIAQLTRAYRQQGRKVGIIAVDATSPITGGALLGDRIRMQDHSCDRGVFIRSVASRGQHGGVAESTPQMVQVLQAAGYEVIFVETVGVGQEDLAIVDVAQTVVAVVTPGLGDEVQAMKAGLFEVAHIVVVNKGDHEGAASTVQDLTGWVHQVVRTVAVKGEGIPELVEAIAKQQRNVGLKGRS
jgi:LAO/AO transport system kinase